MQRDNKKRLFIALNLPLTVKKELVSLQNKLNQKNKEVNWVKGGGLHLTLHFLGYLDKKREEQVKLAMQSLLGSFSELQFTIEKISAFPNLTKPRIIFLACRQTNGRAVFKIQELLGKKLIQLDIPVDQRPWQPHITIGRARRNGLAHNLSDIFKIKQAETSLTINSVELMKSELKSDGAEYREVISYKL